MEWNKPPNKSPWDKNQQSPDIDELLDNLQNKLKFKIPQKNFSLLIIVVVVMDFMAQLQAHLMSHQYEGLMKKANLRAPGGAGVTR